MHGLAVFLEEAETIALMRDFIYWVRKDRSARAFCSVVLCKSVENIAGMQRLWI